MKENKKEIVISPSSSIASPMEQLQYAIDNGIDLAKLEKVMELQERWEKQNAIKAFNEAMARFKANPPKIDKDRTVNYTGSKGAVRYSHASLYNIVDKITSELSKYGLSASWRTQNVDKLVTVTCRISHAMGHYEETSLSALPDSSGVMNNIQSVGSTITYLQRYTLLSMTGLATADQDTDGIVDKPEEPIDENKAKIINSMIEELKIDKEKFLEYMKVESVETIPSSQFAKAKIALEARKNKK